MSDKLLPNTYNTLEALLHEYKDKQVTGYLWRISSKMPAVYKNELLVIKEGFAQSASYDTIVEGKLFCEAKKTSIHIKNIDDQYYIHEFELEKFSESDNFRLEETRSYPALKKLEDHIKKLSFQSLQQLTPSATNPNFNSWQEVAQLFVGFKTTQDA